MARVVAEPDWYHVVGSIRTLVPYCWSDAPDRVIAAAAGSCVVTSTSNGAKSSATRAQTSRTTSCSAVLQLFGFPSVSYGVTFTVAGLPFAFHAVPVIV